MNHKSQMQKQWCTVTWKLNIWGWSFCALSSSWNVSEPRMLRTCSTATMSPSENDLGERKGYLGVTCQFCTRVCPLSCPRDDPMLSHLALSVLFGRKIRSRSRAPLGSSPLPIWQLCDHRPEHLQRKSNVHDIKWWWSLGVKSGHPDTCGSSGQVNNLAPHKTDIL